MAEVDPTLQGFSDEEVPVKLGDRVDHTPDERKVWSGTSAPNLGDPHVPFGETTAERMLRDDKTVGAMVPGQVVARPETAHTVTEAELPKQVEAEQKREQEARDAEALEAAEGNPAREAAVKDEQAARRSAASKKAAATRKAKAAAAR